MSYASKLEIPYDKQLDTSSLGLFHYPDPKTYLTLYLLHSTLSQYTNAVSLAGVIIPSYICHNQLKINSGFKIQSSQKVYKRRFGTSRMKYNIIY